MFKGELITVCCLKCLPVSLFEIKSAPGFFFLLFVRTKEALFPNENTKAQKSRNRRGGREGRIEKEMEG